MTDPIDPEAVKRFKAKQAAEADLKDRNKAAYKQEPDWIVAELTRIYPSGLTVPEIDDMFIKKHRALGTEAHGHGSEKVATLALNRDKKGFRVNINGGVVTLNRRTP